MQSFHIRGSEYCYNIEIFSKSSNKKKNTISKQEKKIKKKTKNIHEIHVDTFLFRSILI